MTYGSSAFLKSDSSYGPIEDQLTVYIYILYIFEVSTSNEHIGLRHCDGDWKQTLSFRPGRAGQVRRSGRGLESLRLSEDMGLSDSGKGGWIK